MAGRAIRYWMVWVGFLLVGGSGLAGLPVGVQAQEDIVLRSNLVTVEVTVTDPQGRPIAGLRPDDFLLYEDDQPRRIEFFQANGERALRPLAVVFAFDVSGSVTPEEAALQRRALEAFLVERHPDSMFALVTFNNEVRVLEGFTKDTSKLLSKLDRFKNFGGSTRLFDALDRSVTLLRKVPRQRNGRLLRRLIVVLTDGFDSASNVNLDDLLRRVNEQEVTVYSVTAPSYTLTVAGRMRVPTPLDATRLISLTGGRDFPMTPGKDYSDSFRAIAKDAATSYTLAYEPGDTPAGRTGFRRISVRLRQLEARVRTSREGYYVQP
ncbi:MAG: VWA domain-containing protein [Chloracidobacterium sp.]|uniref:VWA domain-containing protein n=1 Tax=Chloracidobacterium validum TaxID=2821543 RepID=A0ABX8B956_9BACT|nr:VWA domain-containing protein [Chloracidobacterium validum]QUW02972.1 VWA domain-containing protein [Chloracidobacterium validum]